MQGRVDEAVAGLHLLLQAEPHSGPLHLLLCRAYYSEEFVDAAVSECEAAISTMANNSEAQDWLGRAYGLKAGRAGPLSGFSLARKVRDAFEAAVRLNPRNGDAFDDLGEFYVEAPGIVGGGLDKAAALATQGMGPLPGRARVLRATIAEKQKDFGTAEREFREAAEDSGLPDAWVDLGAYYGRRRQTEQALAAERHAVDMNKERDGSLAHAAEALIKMKVGPQLAMEALRSYLGGPGLSDAAPACKAYTELGKLQAVAGDKTAAKMNFEKALGLASGYLPAKKELAAL